MPRAADFLVIGAQKCGTTTVYEDLRAHSGVFIPDKESSGLLDPGVLTSAGRSRYGALFTKAPAHAVLGEVATTYTMLPTYAGVAERAWSLNPSTRLIYIIREPVGRVISHHHHDVSHGLLAQSIDQAVLDYPFLLDHTRYATQLAPWVHAFGREQIEVLKFEDYVADRAGSVGRLQAFLGLDPEPLVTEEVHNASVGRRVAVGVWAPLSRNIAYRRMIRPLVSEGLRRRMMGMVLPQAPERPAPPTEQTLQLIRRELAPEVARLARLTGEPPLWEMENSTVHQDEDRP